MLKRNKFGRKKQMINGIMFDSIAESDYYLYLLSLQQAGIVNKFEMQHKFELQPAYHKYGKKVKAIEYIADFIVEYADGKDVEVIDVKGHQTRESRIKQKMFDYVYPSLTLIMMVRAGGGWISMEQKKKQQRAANRKPKQPK